MLGVIGIIHRDILLLGIIYFAIGNIHRDILLLGNITFNMSFKTMAGGFNGAF